EAGGFWLAPAKADLHFYDERGIKTDLVTYLKRHDEQEGVDIQIQAGLCDRLPVRLIALRQSGEKSGMKPRYVHYQKAGSKGIQTSGPKGTARKPAKSREKTKRASNTRLQIGQWIILLTNVPQDRLNPLEARVLMRCRWQMELLWKLWKQYGKIDAWQSSK